MKFIKAVAASSVAAMVASGAFAATTDVNATLELALNAIDTAYDAVDGTMSTGEGSTNAALDSLLYHIDNHGTVKSISYSAGSFEGGVFTAGELEIAVHEFEGEIESDINSLKSQLESDFFGAGGKSASDINVADNSNVWAVEGVDGGAVKTWLERSSADADATFYENGLIADLNALEDAIVAASAAGYTAASLQDVDAAADEVVAEGGDTNTALGSVTDGIGNGIASTSADPVEADGTALTFDATYALRDAAIERLETVDLDGGDTVQVNAHLGADDAITVNSVVYSNISAYVDSIVDTVDNVIVTRN